MSQPIRFTLSALLLGLPLAQSAAASDRAIVAQASPSAAQTAPAPAMPPPASPSGSAPPEAPTPPLTGNAAWSALLGNTISGRTPDGPYSEYFKADGTVIHVDRDGKEVGRWNLKEPSICFTYPDDDEEDCRKLQVEGRRGAFLDSDGSSYRFDILPGNPNNL